MSLNWKEIDLVLSELDLAGAQLQKAVQSAYDVLALQFYRDGKATTLLTALTPGACRLHETFRGVPKNDKPLRFAEFLKSRLVNGRVEALRQLGTDRIVRLDLRRGEERFRLYFRLWSNAANLVVTDDAGTVLDAMRRSPKRGEISGGRYAPDEDAPGAKPTTREFAVRELAGEGSFNSRIDAFYAEQGGALSLLALREQVRRNFEGRIGRLNASLENLRQKQAEYSQADRLRQFGDIVMGSIGVIGPQDAWLETDDFYTQTPVRGAPVRGAQVRGALVRIKLDPRKSAAANAEAYYEQYRKAKHGLADVTAEIGYGGAELQRLQTERDRLLAEENPLRLHKALRTGRTSAQAAEKKRPGLSFIRQGWLIIVGRDAAENDGLLRRHVKGNDLWLHMRDYPGSYVFVKARAGKSVPLDVLLDAGNLAVFYSKGRNAAEGDLFYTPVKYLRRAKNGPKGLVIPTHEKNLHVRLDERRLRELETCRES